MALQCGFAPLADFFQQIFSVPMRVCTTYRERGTLLPRTGNATTENGERLHHLKMPENGVPMRSRGIAQISYKIL